MKLVFCGTPEFAVPSLKALLDAGHEVAMVLTQPDKPSGRGMEMSLSPVKRFAVENSLPTQQPTKLKTNEDLRRQLEAIAPRAIVVVAYGRIIPQWMLELPALGNLNVHGSLLPKYRGAAPIQWAVAQGETETGVTIMKLDAGLDTGPVLLERRLPIAPSTMAAQLFPQLSQIGAEALLEALDRLESGELAAFPQDEAGATLAPLLTREDGKLELATRTARQAYDRWRGFYPWPGAHGVFRGKRFLVHQMSVAEAAGLEPGAVLFREGELLVGAASGSVLRLEEVQLEGKPRMDGGRFAKDFQVKAGERIV